MKLFMIAALAAMPCMHVVAQIKKDTTVIKELDEVVVSANKFTEKKKNIAQKIEVISAASIARYNAQNAGDLLIQTGNVFVQKSQQGGSSPVLRGFEASRVLMVIDGVRMNNAIYRSGHLQNVITVDQNMLESVEVLYGPASTLYGSDALGGVIHFRTKQPKLSTTNNLLSTGSSFVRFNTSNSEKTYHVDLSMGGKKFAWLQSYNYSSFGDMRMGDHYLAAYPDFGRRGQYISNIDGIDSIVKNSDDRVQRNSGYRQWDLTEKFLYKSSERVSHSFNFQLSNSSNVPRYDRLQDIKSGALRYADWYYGPQKRLMGSYENIVKHVLGFDVLRTQISYQDIEESRQTREYKKYDRFDSRREHVKVTQLTVDAHKVWGAHELTVGADAQLNQLKSVADRTNLLTKAVSALDTRYPDGDNQMNNFAIYAQHTVKLKEGKWVVNDGIRFQHSTLHSRLVNNTFFNLPFTNIDQKPSAVTGNLGLVYLPSNKTKISLALSSGFRAPNIDDNAKIFESSTSAKQVVFPNPDIKPEYTYNADLSFVHQFTDAIRLDLTGFYTLFQNALVKAPFRLNGQDSVLYNGVKSQVLANQNKNKAILLGLNAAVTIQFSPEWKFYSTLNYTKGHFDVDPAVKTSVYQKQANGSYSLVSANVSTKPLDHIPPVFGKTSLMYQAKRWDAEFYALYNGWKHLDSYNPDGEDNAQYATADGMPSWTTLNIRTQVQLPKKLQLQLALENITDRNYRYFASGFSAPGRSFIICLRSNF